MLTEHIRNIAIIAHVDHGKTTLVDCLLRSSGMFRQNEVSGSCIMDSNALERERGITIFSKNASIRHKEYKINLVDTPGHADFGGEVERIMKMVNSVLLLIDATDGPMPQTKFVLKKSLEVGHRPIVVINKIDRPNARSEWAVEQVFDLFDKLGANDLQLDFPVIYTSAKENYARLEPTSENLPMTVLLDLIVEKVPADTGDPTKPLQMLVTSIDYSDYLGRIAIGKVSRGNISSKERYTQIKRTGDMEPFKISRLISFEGLSRTEVTTATAGDIVGVAGMREVDIGETISDINNPEPLPVLVIEEPTLTINFSVNDSPFSGREGKYITSRQIRDRLFKEVKSNVAMRVEETESQDVFKVSGRGELHLTILVETMRREGYEFSIARPHVVIKMIDGKPNEPEEFVTIDIEEAYNSKIMESMGKRRGVMKNMHHLGDQTLRLEFIVPTRGLFGFQSEFMSMTRGTGIIHRTFHNFIPYCGDIPGRNNGALVSQEAGSTTGYALFNVQERGRLFLNPGEEVYQGMIVGENSKSDDLVVNVCKQKKLTNMRASGSDENVILSPPIKMSLEQILGYLEEDELAEITPKNIRLRKRLLDENARKRDARSRQAVAT
jgi:GTP-binding protein